MTVSMIYLLININGYRNKKGGGSLYTSVLHLLPVHGIVEAVGTANFF